MAVCESVATIGVAVPSDGVFADNNPTVSLFAANGLFDMGELTVHEQSAKPVLQNHQIYLNPDFS
jgi:hypothetical protein